MAEWTVERNNDFIQAVRERELLYNMELKEYHDRNKKVDAWNAVGALFGIGKLETANGTPSLL